MTQTPVKLSKAIQSELDRIAGDRVVVAAVLPVALAEAGAYADLGLRVENGAIQGGSPVLLPPSSVLYARRNLDGWNVKRTDLP